MWEVIRFSLVWKIDSFCCWCFRGTCAGHRKTCIRLCWFEFGNSTSDGVELCATFEELLIAFLAHSVLFNYDVVLVDILQR